MPFKVGEPFNPERLRNLTGNRLYPPAIVGAQIGVDDAKKRFYAAVHRRCSGAKSDGTCFATHETLAGDLGWKTQKTCQRHWPGLQSAGLLLVEHRAGRKPNKYTPLWHKMFEDAWEAISGAQNEPPECEFERTTVSAQVPLVVDRLSGQDPDLSGQVDPFERTTVSANSYDSLEKHSSSSEVCSGVECAAKEQECEEEEKGPKNIQTKNNPRDPAQVTFSALADEHNSLPRPDKSTPEVAVSISSHNMRAAAIIEFATQELQKSRNRDGRLTRKMNPPSPRRVRAVLVNFRSVPHFLVWLDGFNLAGKPELIKPGGDGYGLYISDAEKNAARICQRMMGSPKPADRDGGSLVDKLKARRQAGGLQHETDDV